MTAIQLKILYLKVEKFADFKLVPGALTLTSLLTAQYGRALSLDWLARTAFQSAPEAVEFTRLL